MNSFLKKKYKNEISLYSSGDDAIQVQIQGKLLSDSSSTFIIAEAANNHMCNVDSAKTLIDKAVDAGADAIKFQTYKAEKLVRGDAEAYWKGAKVSQLEYYKKLDKFGENEYKEIFNYADSKGIIAFSTPFDVDSANLLNDLGVPVFKIASCDILDNRLLRTVAGFKKPIILSTGGAELDEIGNAIDVIYSEGNFQLVILACMLSYPTPDEHANLRKVIALKNEFPWIQVGLSDHTEPDRNMIIPSLAVALGAKVIEKHYTLDRSLTGSGHFFSVSPSDLSKMVQNIRLTETVLGEKEFSVKSVEVAARESARRSLVAACSIAKGTVLTSDMIDVKRPADGLSPDRINDIIGREIKKDVILDHKFSLEDFD